MHKKSKGFILVFCVASLLFPLKTKSANSQIWQKTGKYAAIAVAACFALDFTITAADIGIGAIYHHLVKNGKLQGVHLASEHTQKQAADYFDAMHSDNFLDRLLLPIKKIVHSPRVYTGTLVDRLLLKKEWKAFYSAFLGIYISTAMNSNKQLSNSERAFLCHETVHAQQNSSFFYRLSAHFLSSSRLTFKHEYNAEKKTIETLYKLQDFEALEAHVKHRLKNISKLPSTFYFPYITGTLDTYYRIMKKHNPNDELCQEIDKVRTWQPTTNWKEAYQEHQKLLSASQSGQQLTAASAS